MMNQELKEGLYSLNDHDERIIQLFNKNSLMRIGGIIKMCIISKMVMARTDPYAKSKIAFEAERTVLQ